MEQMHVSTFDVKDLRKMRKFINKKGRPTLELNNRIWQRIFFQLKTTTIPYINGEKKHMSSRTSRAVLDEWGDYEIDKTTDYNRYCNFINQSLQEIRSGNTCYCYFYYQIGQLLKFHKDNLRTKFNELGKYWEVWLEKEDDDGL